MDDRMSRRIALSLLLVVLGCSAEAGDTPCDHGGCFHATCEISEQCPPWCFCDSEADYRCAPREKGSMPDEL